MTYSDGRHNTFYDAARNGETPNPQGELAITTMNGEACSG